MNNNEELINGKSEDNEKVEQNNGTLQPEKEQQFDLKKEIFEWVQAIVLALVIALLIRTFLFTLIRVEGSSMVPTLSTNDRLIVWKLMYKPRQGDIIILKPPLHPETPYVKRIIGMPGQTININTSTQEVIIDGEPIDEDYINEPTRFSGNMTFPVKVPDDHVFVMGDNRNNSKDSRYTDVGMIPYDKIIGKATVRIWPLNKIGLVD
jgi:signal peptidase I